MSLFKKRSSELPAPVQPAVVEKTYGSKMPVVDVNVCNVCRACVYLCKNEVFDKSYHRSNPVVIREDRCEDGCTLCADRCRPHAISFVDR